ncbi:unnamed protein product [Larinioides sclopetarius]|uniref:Chitin-binding type-2 domain-containing protein n=1 Tax=Larinioides sclopetarius TaxID=280406 RepID=A0AAV1YVR8_9ARAC
MGLSKVSVGLLSIACLICMTNGSAIKTANQKVDDTLKSASKTFGIKTVTRQTTHSNNGVVTRVFKQTQITTGNADGLSEGTGSHEQFSSSENTQGGNQNPNFQNLPDISAVDHSTGQDDVVHGLLPLDDVKPIQFGTRLGSNTKQAGCSVKGGCSTQISVSGDQLNIESHGEKVPQKVDRQDQETIRSNFEPKDVENSQPQEEFAGQGQQQPENVFSTDFDGQYEETLRNIGQGNQFVDDIKVPVIDTQFPEQGDGLADFEVGNRNSYFVEEQQENQQKQQQENPLDFGYVEQHSQGDSQGVSDVYVTSEVDQQNSNFQEDGQTVDQARNFEFSQGSFQHQDGSSASVVDHNNDFSFQQNTGFQEPFVPQPQVFNEFQQQFVPQSQVSNENSYSFQDNTQDIFLADPIEALRYNVPGNPGEDYPIFYKVPETSFQCNQQPFAAGIYGDMDAQCQVFHFCTESGGQNSFLCPNGTVFNQQYFVCDWWYNYNCSDTPSFYNLNAQLYWDFDSFEPTQIITGTGIGSSEEQQVNNAGKFQDQVNSHHFSSSIPEQVQFQTRVTHSGQSQAHTTSTNQQVQFSVQQQDADSYAEKRQDVINVQSNVRTGFTQQSSLAPNTNLAQKTVDTSHEFNTHSGQTETSVSHTTNQQASSASFPETHSEGFSQQEVSSFQQSHDANVQEGASFDGSHPIQTQQNVNSGESFVQEKSSQHDLPSTSSDPRRGWKPDSDSGTRYPDQSDFVQQHVDDQHQFHANDQSINNVPSYQVNSVEVSSTHDISQNNPVSQEIAPTENSVGFNGQNINIAPQSQIQQQHVQFPLEVSARSDQDSSIDSFEHSEVSHNEGFTTPSPQDIGQQQNNFDSAQDVSFKRQAVFSSLNQDNINQEKASFDDSETVTDEPNILDVILPETFEEVDQDTQSARGDNAEEVNQKVHVDDGVRVADAFDGQQMIDAIQDAVNYDDIIDGFNSRNIGFMNVVTTPEPFDSNQRVYENRPAQVHALSFQQNSNQNVNNDAQHQIQSPNFQQENINEGDIYSIMRGSLNNFRQQNGNQRLSFRPYGQNADARFNYNVEEQKQNQNSVNKFEGSQQNINQGIREQVIFPVDQKQGNEQNQWWRSTQNNENIQSIQVTKQQDETTEDRNTRIPQSHLKVDVSSKENLNGPNNDNQVQSHNSVNINQPQSFTFQPIQPQRPNQNVKTGQGNQVQTDISQFQSGINQPQFQDQNNEPEFHNLNTRQNIQNQHPFQSVNDQSHLNGNNQPNSQNLNNQQHFQGVKGQDQHQNTANQEVFLNNNNNVHNQNQYQSVNNQQEFQNQNQFHNINNQHKFQEEHQFQNQRNQENFQNVNNQQQFQEEQQVYNVNNQQQFENVNNQQQFENVNNQQQFENVNNQQFQVQQQFQNVNVQQHFVNDNSQPEDQSVNNQPHFPDGDRDHAPIQKFEQNAGIKGSSPQEHSHTQNSDEFDSRHQTGVNIHQNQGVKGYHSQQNFRESRNGYNFPRPNLQTINANDAIIYSQNHPRSAESVISYTGWKPIIRY